MSVVPFPHKFSLVYRDSSSEGMGYVAMVDVCTRLLSAAAAGDAIRAAVNAWVLTSTEGRHAWARSRGQLNIGDVIHTATSATSTATLGLALEHHGVRIQRSALAVAETNHVYVAVPDMPDVLPALLLNVVTIPVKGNAIRRIFFTQVADGEMISLSIVDVEATEPHYRVADEIALTIKATVSEWLTNVDGVRASPLGDDDASPAQAGRIGPHLQRRELLAVFEQRGLKILAVTDTLVDGCLAYDDVLISHDVAQQIDRPLRHTDA